MVMARPFLTIFHLYSPPGEKQWSLHYKYDILGISQQTCNGVARIHSSRRNVFFYILQAMSESASPLASDRRNEAMELPFCSVICPYILF